MIRPTAAALLGPAELLVAGVGVDVSAHLAAFAGLACAWRGLRVAAHAEKGPLTGYAARVGGSF